MVCWQVPNSDGHGCPAGCFGLTRARTLRNPVPWPRVWDSRTNGMGYDWDPRVWKSIRFRWQVSSNTNGISSRYNGKKVIKRGETHPVPFLDCHATLQVDEQPPWGLPASPSLVQSSCLSREVHEWCQLTFDYAHETEWVGLYWKVARHQ